MSAKQVYDGLSILLKYEPEGDVATDHEILYGPGPGPDVGEISEEDLKRLDGLRWWWHPDEDCWAIFT